MRILLVHNHYQQPGGEDQVFAAETELFRTHGHAVRQYTVHNDEVQALRKVALATKTLWNADVGRELRALCREHRPQVVHFHNTFPLISPAAYYIARSEGAAVIQTLHNYRLLCPGTTFYRDGRICEDCLGRSIPWPAVVHGCYRGSRGASLVVATMIAAHRLVGTWTRAVDLFVAPTEFLRGKMVEGGIPEGKIVAKPHFLPVDPGHGNHRGGYGLFVGRLAEGKGIERLRQAWHQTESKIPLVVVGDGPLAPLFCEPLPGVEWIGQQSRAEVGKLMQDASFLIFPSESYESFGLTILEAFATGLPVIASKLSAAAELVEHGRTGLHFRPGDAADLAASIAWAADHPEEMAKMGNRARTEYLTRYTAEANHRALMSIYHRAMRESASVVDAALLQTPPTDLS